MLDKLFRPPQRFESKLPFAFGLSPRERPVARALRALVIGENHDDQFVIERMLRQEFDDVQVEQVVDDEPSHVTLSRYEFDLVITDSWFGWGEGVISVKGNFPDSPVILSLDADDKESALESLPSDVDRSAANSNDHFHRLEAVCQSALERLREIRRTGDLVRYTRSLLERLNVGLFRCTARGTILEINAAAREILGLPAATRLYDLLPDWLMEHEAFAPHRQSSVSVEKIFHRPHSHSGSQWIRVSAASHPNEVGEFVIEGFLENVTLNEGDESHRRLRAQAVARVSRLSPRERQVMQLVVSGKTNKVIAVELEITIKTVEMHRSHLMKKLNVNNLAHLVRLAMTANPD